MQDEVIFRCIHAPCGRTLPRRVEFCPYCGTAQRPGAAAPARAAATPPAPAAAAPRPLPAAPPLPGAPVQPQPVQPQPAPVRPPPTTPAAPAGSAGPPLRRPVRLRYWLLALAALWLVWIYAKPDSRKIDERIERAVAMANECEIGDAQSELAALRSTRATQQQQLRLQQAINAAAPGCEKRRARATAWSATALAVDSALAAYAFDKAQGRLASFVRRWGADAQTRSLKESIDARHGERLLDEADTCLAKDERACAEVKIDAAGRLRRPELRQRIATLRAALAQRAQEAPAPDRASQHEQSARNLIADAEREISQGHYRAAGDKMDLCLAMVDAGNRDCAALKARAARMARDMLHCVAAGREWIGNRCR